MKKIVFFLFFYLLSISGEASEKKIALLFLTIGDLNQTELWKEYLEPHMDKFTIYIHSKKELEDPFFTNHRIKNIVPTSWGHICLATRSLLRSAIECEENCKFVLLSESCVPLVDPISLYESLIKENVSYLSWCNPWWPESHQREVKALPKEHRKANQTWFVLNRELAALCANDTTITESINSYSVADESYPSSLLSFYGYLDQVLDHKTTFVDWSRPEKGGAHPYTFKEHNEADFKVLRSAKEKGFLFARKVSSSYAKEKLIELLQEN